MLGYVYPQEVNNELQSAFGGGSRRLAAVQHMPPPRGVRTNPNYEVTAEKLKKAAEKLHVPLPAAEEQSFAALQRRRRPVSTEPTRTLGGGRYVI